MINAKFEYDSVKEEQLAMKTQIVEHKKVLKDMLQYKKWVDQQTIAAKNNMIDEAQAQHTPARAIKRMVTEPGYVYNP
jgi:hypothetical protein